MSQPTSKSRKTINILIYPKFQLILILVNTLTLFITVSFVGLQSWRSLAYLRQLGVSVDLPTNHTYFKFIDMQSGHLWINLILAFALAAFVSSTICLYISHRMAGPIVRLKNYLDTVTETKKVTEELQFRKNDFFSDLPQALNQAVKAIKEP
jgi:hypothetical protein